MNTAAAIEKNYTALLRLISCWLIAALCVRRARLTLPARIGFWVCDMVSKAEAATGYLMMASGHDFEKCSANDRIFLKMANIHRAGLEFHRSDGDVYITTIIDRLKALRSALKRLASKSMPLAKPGVAHNGPAWAQARLMAKRIFHQPIAHPIPP